MRNFAVALAFASMGTALAQTPVAPFGIAKGMSLAQLLKMGAKPTETPGVYELMSPPTPNSNFEFYTVKATKTHGVCRVAGLGVTIKNDSDGYGTRKIFNDLAYALNQKYGTGKKYDFLHSGSIWDDEDDWMMSIHEEERSLTSFWSAEFGSKLPKGLGSIMLDTRALNSKDGYVAVSYEFDNLDKCNAELKGNSGKGL